MEECFDPQINIDWKTPGIDFLSLFHDYYPHVSLFSSAEFERLLDELAHEMPETCFEALAFPLAQLGYDVWNLDCGSDNYYPIVTATAQRQAFTHYWTEQERDDPNLMVTLVLFEPLPPVATKHGQFQGSKLNWLAERHDYSAPTYVHSYNYRDGWAGIHEHDEDGSQCFLIDYHPWPPVEHDVLEHRSDEVEAHDLSFIDAYADRSLWKRRVKRGESSDNNRYEYEICHGNEVQRFGPAQAQWPEFREPCEVLDAQIFERQIIYLPTLSTRIWRITAELSEIVFEATGELTLLVIGPQRLLIMQNEGPLCWIWNRDTAPQTVAAQPMPAPGGDLRPSTAYLGGDEILLFSTQERQNAEHAGYFDTLLLAWRFNFITGAVTKAKLEGFGSKVRQETRILVTQPKHSITWRTFSGQLEVCRGHGDWWIWNYHTNTFGTLTLAWLWNQRNDQVLKISSRDIPRFKPQIRYLATQDRYLAFETDFVARLPAFNEMLEAKGGAFLRFD